MNHVTHHLTAADISIFSPKIRKFCYMKKYRYRLHFNRKFLILLTFPESLKIVLIKMVTILRMSAKMTTSGLLKMKVFSDRGYDIIVSIRDAVSNKILSLDSNIFKMCSCDQNLATLAFL